MVPACSTRGSDRRGRGLLHACLLSTCQQSLPILSASSLHCAVLCRAVLCSDASSCRALEWDDSPPPGSAGPRVFLRRHRNRQAPAQRQRAALSARIRWGTLSSHDITVALPTASYCFLHEHQGMYAIVPVTAGDSTTIRDCRGKFMKKKTPSVATSLLLLLGTSLWCLPVLQDGRIPRDLVPRGTAPWLPSSPTTCACKRFPR